jgi:hypothetical protein
MFEVFKKYVIKNDRKLLPVLDDMKLFKIKYIDNDEDKDIKRENIDTDEKCDTFQLPHNVTGIEIKDIFALVVDKYKNQKGVNKDRYVYILAKIDINSVAENITYSHNTGLNLFVNLIGISIKDLEDLEEDTTDDQFVELNNYQKKVLLSTAGSGKKYILLELPIFNNLDIQIPKTFVIINKKKSKKINVEKRVLTDIECSDNTLITIKELLVNIFFAMDYIQSEGIEIKEMKNKCIVELKRQNNKLT